MLLSHWKYDVTLSLKTFITECLAVRVAMYKGFGGFMIKPYKCQHIRNCPHCDCRLPGWQEEGGSQDAGMLMFTMGTSPHSSPSPQGGRCLHGNNTFSRHDWWCCTYLLPQQPNNGRLGAGSCGSLHFTHLFLFCLLPLVCSTPTSRLSSSCKATSGVHGLLHSERQTVG